MGLQCSANYAQSGLNIIFNNTTTESSKVNDDKIAPFKMLSADTIANHNSNENDVDERRVKNKVIRHRHHYMIVCLQWTPLYKKWCGNA